MGMDLGRRAVMNRHTPRSMLGLAMLLVSTGAECARAAPRAKTEPLDDKEPEQVEYRKYDAHGRVTHAATIAGPPMVAPGWSVPLSVACALDAPPVNRHAKPRSNSGQRRAAAKRWWIR